MSKMFLIQPPGPYITAPHGKASVMFGQWHRRTHPDKPVWWCHPCGLDYMGPQNCPKCGRFGQSRIYEIDVTLTIPPNTPPDTPKPRSPHTGTHTPQKTESDEN